MNIQTGWNTFRIIWQLNNKIVSFLFTYIILKHFYYRNNNIFISLLLLLIVDKLYKYEFPKFGFIHNKSNNLQDFFSVALTEMIRHCYHLPQFALDSWQTVQIWISKIWIYTLCKSNNLQDLFPVVLIQMILHCCHLPHFGPFYKNCRLYLGFHCLHCKKPRSSSCYRNMHSKNGSTFCRYSNRCSICNTSYILSEIFQTLKL